MQFILPFSALTLLLLMIISSARLLVRDISKFACLQSVVTSYTIWPLLLSFYIFVYQASPVHNGQWAMPIEQWECLMPKDEPKFLLKV